MPNLVPKIDQRNQEQLVPELRRLIYTYCRREWSDLTELEADRKTDAMVHIFTNMMGKITDRLNKAPEKNFISFLNMIGISPTPPRAAKAPLLFKAKDDWEKISTIPAGTKVSAQPENQGEVIFETEKDVTVVKPRPVRAVSLDPKEDRFSNQDFLFAEEPAGLKAELFRGDSTVVHRLYMGQSRLLGYQEAGSRLKVRFTFAEPGFQPLQMDWFVFNEEGAPVRIHPDDDNDGQTPTRSANAEGMLSYTFSDLKECKVKTVSGYDQSEAYRNWTNKWIFAELTVPLTDKASMPDIEDIRMELAIDNPEPLNPESAVYNGTPIDMSKDFYPFGEKPKVNDTFYIACDEAFSKENSEIALSIEMSNPAICGLPNTSHVNLSWEYWNGFDWVEIDSLHSAASAASQGAAAQLEILRSPETLTSSGTVYFQCPGMKPSVLNGEEKHWIRVRITGGNYGEDAKYEYQDTPVKIGDSTVNIAQLQFTKATYAPPSVHKLTVDYIYTMEDHPEAVLTENNFSFDEKTWECHTPGEYFKPFYPCVEQDPTFYLAFDRDISDLPVSLFFPLNGDQLGDSPIVAWEYWDGRKWMTLSVNDAIRHFTRREILQFAVPSDIEKRPLFGTEHYWIRARLEEGSFTVPPQVSAIFSNAVWARNSNTIQDEILGSSNGEENQVFHLSKTPVLPGQSLYVREASGQNEWVLWEEVGAFSTSESGGRHYMLDRSTGTITFGDAKNGMIPPMGVDNIKCSYKHGGGAIGNVEAGSITKVWDSFEWLDSVTNPVAADGGFDREEPEQAQIRGPHTLKSWQRGVTAEDMEWLVREAMPQIAKVKVLSAMNRKLKFTPGRATIIVVPDSNEAKPYPSQELLGEIETYLCERTSTVLNTHVPGIEVIGPDYVRVGVEAVVVFASNDQRKVIEGQIIDNLKRFFHPLYGGDGGAGWDLGKNLYVSEVFSVIKNTPGVDFVEKIAIKASLQCFTLKVDPFENGPYRPLAAYPKFSAVRTNDNTIQFALAEQADAGAGVKTLMVKAFKENEIIRLLYRNYAPVELYVESVDGDILECRTANGEPLEEDYPEGSDVQYDITEDMMVRSFILNPVAKGSETFFLKIALLEPKDVVYLSRADEYINTTPLRIRQVRSENIFLEPDELIFGGIHFINKKEELLFPFLLDKNTGGGTSTVHDLTETVPACLLDQIPKEERKYLARMEDIPANAIRCEHCFPKKEE